MRESVSDLLTSPGFDYLWSYDPTDQDLIDLVAVEEWEIKEAKKLRGRLYQLKNEGV